MKLSSRNAQAVAWLFSLGALTACSRPEPPPVPVRAVKVMTIGVQSQEFSHEYAGEVRARSEARLGFRVSGKVAARPAEVGQRVRAGQVLAQLDGSDYALASQAAQAQVVAAATQRDLAAADVKRYAELKAQNFISGAELDRREAALKAAQASLNQALAQSGVQSNQKGYTALVADRPGVVVGVEAEPGQVVAAGTPVVRLAYDGARDVVVAVPEDQIAAIRVGGPARVRLWASDAVHNAQVREVAAIADPASRTFAVKLSLQPSLVGGAEVPLGSTAYVQFVAPAAAGLPGLITVPTSALWRQGQGSAVWVFDASALTVKAQPVQVGMADGNRAIIVAGLKGGEQVVVAGVHVLVEGEKVTLYQEKNASKKAESHASIQSDALPVRLAGESVANGSAPAAKGQP